MSPETLHLEETTLSPRQRQCLQLLAEGQTASAIAFRLGISVRMVRLHLARARAKLGAVSSAQAVHMAHKMELLD